MTEFEPDALCMYETDSFYAAAEVTYRVEPSGHGTKFTIHDKGYLRGIMRLIEPILNRIDIRYRKQQPEIIKQALEGESQAGA